MERNELKVEIFNQRFWSNLVPTLRVPVGVRNRVYSPSLVDVVSWYGVDT